VGYTHYWYRPKTIRKQEFESIVRDFKVLVPYLAKAGCPLAGPRGEGEAVINKGEIAFNGPRACGHPKNSKISIPWPTGDAGGIANPFKENAKTGTRYAGAEIRKRCCDGDCSYESFIFSRIRKPEKWEKVSEEGWFDFCKTAFRPYDLAVIAFLIVAKHHLGSKIRVRSDGTDGQWFDGKLFCQVYLGFGQDMAISEDGNELMSAVAAKKQA